MKRGFIFDLDGTVYLGERSIEGAAEAINTIRKRGDKVVFLTNKSIARREDYVEKLNKMGIETTLEQVINSNYITAKYLKEKMAQNEKALIIGEDPLLDELADAGIKMTNNPDQAAYVVLGWDRKFTYEKLNLAFQAWVNNAKVIATNPDRTCPLDRGEIPDCGAIIGAFEGATGRRIGTITGKPSRLMADYAVKHVLKLSPSKCYMVGDRLETDIRMGNENGLHTVLVLTGVTTKERLYKSNYQPSFTLESVKEIVHV